MSLQSMTCLCLFVSLFLCFFVCASEMWQTLITLVFFVCKCVEFSLPKKKHGPFPLDLHGVYGVLKIGNFRIPRCIVFIMIIIF